MLVKAVKRLPNPPLINYDALDYDTIAANQFLRLNTIYYIVDEDGQKRPFNMRPEQYDFYRNMHNLNIILKARQLGFTTLIQLFLLDNALFMDNKSCGVIAHNKEDAKKFFDKKIKYAYDNIPEDFKRKYVPNAEQDSANQLKFSNGSYISVGTSLRSDTLQFLHISEFGKMCAKYPDKAEEVVSGALNTVKSGNWITIESTGEGANGHFYDMTMKAKKKHDEDTKLTEMDYKFFFYPWWETEKYVLKDNVRIEDEDANYFKELKEQSGISLNRQQKNWYVIKSQEQGDRMMREFPATPEESFRGIIRGAPFARIMASLRRQGHITRVPWVRSIPVNTFWDLGYNDKMAIWFHQRVGFEDRFINFFEDNFHSLDHYAQYLKSLPYTYGEHYLPHDGNVTEMTQLEGKERWEVLEGLGVKPVILVPRTKSEERAIETTRQSLNSCYFDMHNCDQGIKCLENVRYQFDEKMEEFRNKLLRNWAKHGADAIMQWAQGYRRPAENSVDVHSTGHVVARNTRNRNRNTSSRGCPL